MTSERWGTSNLVCKRLKYSRFDDLNDPFELLSAHLGERDARKFYRVLKTAVTKRFAVVCLSATWQSPVMWAHYADKHKGLCLGFDVAGASEVLYESKRLKHELDESQSGVRNAADLIKIAMTTKFKEWAYEKEWRGVCDLTHRQPDAEGHYFQEFCEGFALREVIIGARCKLSPSEVAALVGAIDHEVIIKKARPAFRRFEIVEQKLVEPVIIGKTSVRQARLS